MLKYTIGALAALVIVIVTAFMVLSQFAHTSADAQGGPAPVVTITVDDTTLAPDHLDIARDKIVHLHVDSKVPAFVTAIIDSDRAEQFPIETKLDDRHAIESSVPRPQIQIPGLGIGDALIRFKEAGDYQIEIRQSNHSGVVRTIGVTVR